MIRDEIIYMARKTGLKVGPSLYNSDDVWGTGDDLERFAKLLVEQEREACAKVAENRMLDDKNENIKKGYFYAQQTIAEDIRSRGQE